MRLDVFNSVIGIIQSLFHNTTVRPIHIRHAKTQAERVPGLFVVLPSIKHTYVLYCLRCLNSALLYYGTTVLEESGPGAWVQKSFSLRRAGSIILLGSPQGTPPQRS